MPKTDRPRPRHPVALPLVAVLPLLGAALLVPFHANAQGEKEKKPEAASEAAAVEETEPKKTEPEDKKAKPAEEEKESKIHPRLEKALFTFIEKLGKKHTTRAEEALREQVGEVFELAKIEDGELKAMLIEAGKEAVAEAQKTWADNALEAMGKMYGSKAYDEELIDNLVNSLEEAVENTEMLPPTYRITSDISPLETEAWKKALELHLTPKQLAALDVSEEERAALVRKKFAQLVKQSSERYRNHFSTKINREVKDIQGAIDLGGERSDKLEESAREAIELALAKLADLQLEQVLKSTEQERKEILKRGYVSTSTSQVKQPHETKEWDRILDGLLGKAERKSLDDYTADRQKRSILIGAQILTTALDDLLSLNAEQREKMVEVMKGPAEKSLLRSLTEPNYSLSLNMSSVISYAKQADAKKFAEPLNGWQKEFWEKHLKDMNRSRSNSASKKKDKKKSPPRPPGLDEILIERAIASHIFGKAPAKHAFARARYEGLIEDVGLIADLTDEQRTRLQIAGKGAAEAAHRQWLEQYDGYIRRQAKSADADSVRAQLSSIGNVSFGRSENVRADQLWEGTLASILDEKQEKALAAHRESRLSFRWDTIGRMNAQLLDSQARLSNEQVDTVASIVAKRMVEFGPDLRSVFGSWNQDNPWYLNSYYSLIGLHMIPEKQFKETVGDEKHKIWKEKLSSRGRSYWSRLEQAHKERIEKEKKAKGGKKGKEGQDEKKAADNKKIQLPGGGLIHIEGLGNIQFEAVFE